MPPLPIAITLVIFVLFVGLEKWSSSRLLSYKTAPWFETFSPADWMPIVISWVLLIAALWVILSKRYVPTDRHWAYATIGTIVGYLLAS